MATAVESNLKAPFLVATTPRCREGHYFIPELVHFTLDPYLIMLPVKQGLHQVPFFESLVWLNLGLNPGLPEHWRTLYSLGEYCCNTASWGLDWVASLSLEILLCVVLCWSGIYTKPGINMVGWLVGWRMGGRELQLTRLTNEGQLFIQLNPTEFTCWYKLGWKSRIWN